MNFVREHLDSLLLPYKGNVPGCAMQILQHGKVVSREVLGFSNLDRREAVSEKTNFRLASVSKHVTAAAIMKLISEKKVSLETSLKEIFPDFPAYGNRITIFNLLTHTSGIRKYEEAMDIESEDQILDPDILGLMMKESSGVFLPGEKFEYSDTGYCLLACVVEAITGMRFSEYVRSAFFVPLDMTTTYINDEGVTGIPYRAYGYSREGEDWILTDQNMTSATQGDGGVYSSLEDLVRWDAYVETIPELFQSRVLTDQEPKPVEYSFGFFRRTYKDMELQYHRGSSIGFRTGYLRIPEKKLAILFLSNRNEGSGDEICEKLLDSVLREL